MVPILLFGAGIAVGLGVAALAPGLMPQIARTARPMAKEALKTALIGYTQLRIAAAEAAEAADDLMAEVGHEIAAAPPEATAPPTQVSPGPTPPAPGPSAAAMSTPAVAAAAAAATAAARAAAAVRGTADG